MTNSRASTRPKMTQDILGADFTTTSTSLTDLTGLTITSQATGIYLALFTATCSHSAQDGNIVVALYQASTILNTLMQPYVANGLIAITLAYQGTSANNIVKLQAKTDTGTMTIKGASAGDDQRATFSLTEWA